MRLLRFLAPVTCVLAVLVTRPVPFAALAAGADNIVCRIYLDPHDKFTRVVAPEQQWASLGQTDMGESSAVLSNISVNYTGFTGSTGLQAQAAFQAAVDIWKSQIASSVAIVVDAEFKDLGSSGLLGSAGSSATRDFPAAPRAGTFYPFPLANKVSGTDIGAQFFGAGASNIGANFNSNPAVNWYFGTDGVVPAGKVDFESVVLHELGHGLGFLGGAFVTAATGEGTIGGLSSNGVRYPYIYDTFVADAPAGGSFLNNTSVYPNPGTALGTALRGNSLYWEGTTGKSSNSGVRPKLYAPATFSGGSTFSHLDESTYPPGHINSLMTPSIGSAEAIHTPGPITLGMFADMGWGSQCSFALDRATQSVLAAGASFTVSVIAASGCAWTSSTTASFVTITSGASGTGSGTVSMTVSANATAQRGATVTIAGITFTVSQNGAGPTMSLDKTALIFGAVNSGAAFTSQTGTQTVRLTQTGTGTVTWTASSTTPWLLVSPSSGSGSATLSISTQFAAGLSATQTGSITLTFTGAGNSAGPVTVTLTSLNGAQAAAPVGSFDTPLEGTTGVTGSLGVTGWAMDDIEIAGVRILRDPVAGEPAGLVLLGNAVLVEGARLDVQPLFPNSPRNTRAGWGYLLLTNFLPALGNGTFKLYAIADDRDGHSTTLGTKTITCTNSSATTPFGAIDTPVQGGSVSGTLNNFGWVLGPNPRRADPPGGGTVRVVIDGAIVSALPAQWTSRSDLTALFPASSFPGIPTALGVAVLDTTPLTNGVHTISWLVTDNLGSATGIGSRYFTVANGSLYLDPSPSGLTSSGGSTVVTGPAFLSMPRAAALRFDSVSALADEIAAAPADLRGIAGRRGYDLTTPLRGYGFRNGVAIIQSEELDRIELQLEGIDGSRAGGRVGRTVAGYLRVSGGVAPLPIGSSLNASTGLFTWQPGVGFVGTYDLVFVRWSGGRVVARQEVRVVLNPKGSNRVGPQVLIDTPRQQRDVAQPFVVAGWAADLDSTIDAGVDAVHVWAYPLAGGNPTFIGAAAIGGARPDVAAVYGERFARSGYGIVLKGLEPGHYDIAVFAYSTVTGGFVPAKTVRLTVR